MWNNEKRRQWRLRNLDRARLQSRVHYHRHREQILDYWYISRYGLTRGERDAMYAERGGKCDICGKVFAKLQIDHDHKTGIVRGLLCARCNSKLSLMDSHGPAVLRYLEAAGGTIEEEKPDESVKDAVPVATGVGEGITAEVPAGT